MPLSIQPYTADLTGAGRRFNERMRDGKAPSDFLLPENGAGEPHYLAVDETGEARGGIIIQRHEGLLGGEVVSVLNLQSPLSEGIVNPKYTLVAAQLIRHALKMSPFVYVVGMGAEDRPLPRVLRTLGWRVLKVPFFFRLLQPGRCFGQIQPLRRNRWVRYALDAAAYSGLAPLAGMALHRAGAEARAIAAGLERSPSPGWDGASDMAWRRRMEGLSFAVQRDAAGAVSLYRGSSSGAQVFRAGREGAWFSLQVTAMRGNAYFGDLKVATLADLVGPPELLSGLAVAAGEQAKAMGAELLVANFQDAASRRACVEAGLRTGPSNYLWAASPKLAEKAVPETSYISRRDGDGLINLSRDAGA